MAIYLDHNATTPIDPRVAAAISECYAAAYANPTSSHAAGRAARQALEAARDGIAQSIGIDTRQYNSPRIILTSGGTESNNLALRGLTTSPGKIIISAIEHPSVTGVAQYLQAIGHEIDLLPVLPSGVVDVGRLSDLLTDQTRLVSVMLGNNETGVLQPVEEIADICRRAGVPLHSDAVQVVGKLPVSFPELGVAALTISAHKFHGPRGIGALVVENGRQLDPILHGGFQQQGHRPGTESVALAVGMHKALELWQAEAAARQRRLKAARDRLQRLLMENDLGAVVLGEDAERLPHTLNISFPGLDRQALVMALDQAGVYCATGSACASGSSEPSTVLVAMGLDSDVVRGSLRISLGATTSTLEIDSAADIISCVVNDLRRSFEARNSAAPSR